jgi:hypothetical protein
VEFEAAKGLRPNPILSFSQPASLPAAPNHPADKNGGLEAS